MSALYTVAQRRLLIGAFDWLTLPAAAYLVSSAYVPNFATDTTVSNIPPGALLAGPVALQNQVVTSGVARESGALGSAILDFGILVIPAVAGIVLVDQTPGVGALSALILYLNQGTGFGLPVNGLDCQIVWDTRGIFSP